MKYLNPLTKLLFAGVVFLMSSSAMAQIGGSAHDLSAQGFAGGEICIVCHTPHNATEATSGPLWDHEITATLTFGLYTSPTNTLDATVGQPSGASKLCLSCHDGTVAVDSFGGTTGSVLISTINADADLGIDLSDDHPVSFIYNTALSGTDGELFDPAVATTSLGGTIEADLLFGLTTAATVECASCHDVHDQASNTNLLRISNAGSDLCLTCHDK